MKTRAATMIAITVGALALGGCRPILDPEKHDTEELGRSPDLPKPLDVYGSYQITTTVDLTAASVAPTPAHDALTTLAELRDDPAGLFFDLLAAAGVPLVHELQAVLPGILEDQLADWIDAALEANGVDDEVDAVLARAETILTSVDLVSVIDLPTPDADGYGLAEHTLTELHWAPIDGVALGTPIPGDPSAMSEEMGVWTEVNRYGVEVTFDKHGFGRIDYGELAWDALNKEMDDRTGLDVRGHLGAVADCPAVAASVADNCVLGQCVGHADDLTELCEQGLDAAVDLVHEQIASYRIEGLVLGSGSAVVTSRGVSKGIWSATLDVGMGPREVPAHFIGRRL